jgi:F-type H+-transporting ATPase subunit alpha
MQRPPINSILETGIKAIDTCLTVGRGQRLGLVAGSGVGKSMLLGMMTRNTRADVVVIGLIGERGREVQEFINNTLGRRGMQKSVVIAAPANSSPLERIKAAKLTHLVAEYFRDRGEDALIVYDDLTKQAFAYRQVSLLLRRPPGREAYPGDVFYLHSRLLERAARVNEAYVEKFTKGAVKGKTGSLTALPIIETQAGDVSAFVPTNVISITDGQIFLETDLFNAGVRPAINAGVSVSRVGGAAQTKIIKKLSGGIRTDLAQYRELAAFAQFASDLDDATRRQLERGKRVVELLKQPQYQPLQVWELGVILFAVNNGYLDDVEVSSVLPFEKGIKDYLKSKHAGMIERIESSKELSKDDEAELVKALVEFKKHGTF